MAEPAPVLVVELKLSEPESLRDAPDPDGVGAGEWKSYPYGFTRPEGVSERVADAMALDAEDDLLEECRRFVQSQYDRGDTPLAWRIMKGSTQVEGGTENPPPNQINSPSVS